MTIATKTRTSEKTTARKPNATRPKTQEKPTRDPAVDVLGFRPGGEIRHLNVRLKNFTEPH